MIPRGNILEWQSTAPWRDESQVEQDLVISRAMVDLFSDQRITSSFAMRGGTALHKLALSAPLRYSEDIDLVQVVAGPIKPFFDALRDQINPWLGDFAYEHKAHSVRAIYRFETESTPVRRMKLKIEANTREHFSVHGLRVVKLHVDNPWYTGDVDISTFETNELLATKLRALYQRKKARDLFDLHVAGQLDHVDLDRVVAAFSEYLGSQDLRISQAEFIANLDSKLQDRVFRADIAALLAPGVQHDPDAAAAWARAELLSRLV